ncbi:MAG: cytochrome c3 family protein [Planctomycetota bacterium]
MKKLLLPLSLLVAACSSLSSYEVLSFFFDGVPDPSMPEPEPLGVPGSSGPLTLEERAAIQERRLPKVTLHLHKPWDQNECSSCHRYRSTRKRVPTWAQSMAELKMPKTELCWSCHDPFDGKYVHGPAAAGECLMCHYPHKSEFPHLVRAEKTASLCAKCHSGQTFMTEAKHEEFKDQDCVGCHDPHASERAYFLRESAAVGGDRKSGRK